MSLISEHKEVLQILSNYNKLLDGPVPWHTVAKDYSGDRDSFDALAKNLVDTGLVFYFSGLVLIQEKGTRALTLPPCGPCPEDREYKTIGWLPPCPYCGKGWDCYNAYVLWYENLKR